MHLPTCLHGLLKPSLLLYQHATQAPDAHLLIKCFFGLLHLLLDKTPSFRACCVRWVLSPLLQSEGRRSCYMSRMRLNPSFCASSRCVGT